MAITDWPADDRPREKLLNKGADALSDAELLAIFLRTGIKGQTAVDLARSLLQEFGSLRNLIKADQKTFCQGKGLGEAKYVQLQAVMEMSRRYLGEAIQSGDVMSSPAETRHYLTSHLAHLPYEVFSALFLDNKHQVITFKTLFQGTIDGASVHPREVVKQSLQLNASALIFAHNHPSGCVKPSQADISITRKLKDALGLVDIRVLDHFIIGGNEAYSFAEHGML